MSDVLWRQVGVCFDTDDGSLPGVEITPLSPPSIAAIYSMLRARSRLAQETPEFWSNVEQLSKPVDSVPNAAELVASDCAEAFHIVVDGIVACGVALPCIGVFVWSDTIELDYRMGKDWRPAQVGGFFSLLKDCCILAPEASVIPSDFEGPPYPDRFRRAWSSFACGSA